MYSLANILKTCEIFQDVRVESKNIYCRYTKDIYNKIIESDIINVHVDLAIDLNMTWYVLIWFGWLIQTCSNVR